MNTVGKTILGLAAILASAAPATADPVRGETLFAACAACHQTGQTSSRTGPSLRGIIGRPAGSLNDFRYSRAMSQSGIVWSEDNISQFIQHPQGFLRGTRMAFSGIRSEQDRSDIIDYLKSISR